MPQSRIGTGLTRGVGSLNNGLVANSSFQPNGQNSQLQRNGNQNYYSQFKSNQQNQSS